MVQEKVADRHPADEAELLEELTEKQALSRLRQLDPEEAAQALEAMEPWQSSRLLEELKRGVKSEIIGSMEPDDSADILQELPTEERDELLSTLTKRRQDQLGRLLGYPEDSAGGLMSPEVVALRPDLTVEEAIEELRRQGERLERANYAYVTDGENVLLGVLPLRELAFKDPHTQLESIMNKDVNTISPDVDGEEVARAFDKYDYLALPVANGEGRLLGVVTVDDVIDLMRQEDTEDMLGMVGVFEAREESIFTPWYLSLRHRLPWLFVNLGTALLAALVVGLFQGTIERIAVLAVFMPVVAGQGGNSGAQTVAILIRSIALGDIEKGHRLIALSKESKLGVIHGLSIGLTLGLITFFWQGDLTLALVVGASMILSMVTAGIAGVLMPLGLKALGLDPALSSNIWMTTITDVSSFFFLLGLASWILL